MACQVYGCVLYLRYNIRHRISKTEGNNYHFHRKSQGPDKCPTAWTGLGMCLRAVRRGVAGESDKITTEMVQPLLVTHTSYLLDQQLSYSPVDQISGRSAFWGCIGILYKYTALLHNDFVEFMGNKWLNTLDEDTESCRSRELFLLIKCGSQCLKCHHFGYLF